MRNRFHWPGMRTIKTMVSVAICFLLFLPFWGLEVQSREGPLNQIGPFYACIAAIVCMQDSVEKTVQQGRARLIGTGVGGVIGILILWLAGEHSAPLWFGFLLSVGVMLTIWLCDLMNQPAACSIGGVVCCCVLLSKSGPERYFYTIARIVQTAVGIVIGVGVNMALPDNRNKKKKEDET